MVPHGDFTGVELKVTSSVTGCVWQCMVRSPATLNLSLPADSTLFDLKVMSGHLAVSKKSGDLRWPSRFSFRVSTEEASIFTLTLLFEGSSLSQFSVEETLPNSP